MTHRARRTWTSALDADADADDARAACERYARHLALDGFGVDGQRALCAARVLVVGAGGLGCPLALYLAGAGVGAIEIVDGDRVEVSNLHRQVCHEYARAGEAKCASLRRRMLALNDRVEVTTREEYATRENVCEMVAGVDLVCDCTDNPKTRYLLSDACRSTGTPLVSAAAVGFEGQLTVLCARRDGECGEWVPAPCYRCLFPTPPAAGDRATCGGSGVLGVVPGVMGTFQALETIKTLAGIGESMTGHLMMFDALSARPTTTLRLANRMNPECPVCCGEEKFDVATYDYDGFLSTPCPFAKKTKTGGLDVTAKPVHGPGASIDEALQRNGRWKRMQAREVEERVANEGDDFLLVDVRPKNIHRIASLKGSVSVPISVFDEDESQREIIDAISRGVKTVCFVCAGGNNSQRAADWFAKTEAARDVEVFDLCGGLASWRREVDASFPSL